MKYILPIWRRYWQVAILMLFLLTRLYIWIDKPTEFTEIIYSYMPYAHLWASGTMPYTEQWYEYPPLTIPLFYFPHVVDRETNSTALHINYGQAYRGQLLIIDALVFVMIWWSLRSFKVKTAVKVVSLLYYCLITAKAHDFIYDTMDLVFAAALVLSVVPTWQSSQRAKSRVLHFGEVLRSWLGYWMAVALKLLNGPLGLPFAILKIKHWRTNWLALGFAAGLIWGIPLLLFRSSLSVMLVFHQIRGLQVDSLGGIIVRTLNSFVQSDRIIEIYKNYETVGPLTDIMLQILSVIFPLGLVLFIGWSTWQAWRLKDQEKYHDLFRLSITFGFVLLLMIISKVLSRPFVLWHVPLLAMLPFSSVQKQLRFLIPSVIALSVTMTAIPDGDVGPFRISLIIGMIRSLAFLYLAVMWWRWHREHFHQVKSAQKA